MVGAGWLGVQLYGIQFYDNRVHGDRLGAPLQHWGRACLRGWEWKVVAGGLDTWAHREDL